MNKTLTNMIFAGVGAIIGGAIAYITTRIHYENEIEAIKDAHAKDLDEVRAIYKTFHDETIKKANDIANTPKIIDCNDVGKAKEYIESIGYGVPKPDDSYPEEEMPEADATLYIIDESEFGLIDHFETESLLYFEDEVLTYSNYTLVEEPQVFRNIGAFDALADSLDDIVYVRDLEKHCDYEILYDNRNYRDDILPMLASPDEN